MARKVKAVSTEKTTVPLTVVERAKKFYERAKAYESDQRLQELDDIRFVGLLEQWPAELKAIREGDPQGSRPCLVVDKTNQYVNQIVNSMRQNRPSIKARPVDDAGDIKVAEVYQGIIRHIEDVSKADIAYDWAGEGAVKTGTGYFRIITEYVGDSFQQEIRIARIRNRFTVYWDPDAKEPDGSDAKEVLITMMIKRDDYEAMYPNKELMEWSSSSGDSDWADKDHVRIAEYFYIDKKEETLYLLEDGNSMFKSDYEEKLKDPANPLPPMLKERKGYRTIVKWCKVTGADELESTVIPGQFIPVVRVIGIETDIDGKLHTRGVVRGIKDPQRMYNYQRSTMVETLGLSSKAPWVAAAGQIEGFEAEWASSNRTNRAVLKYKPVNINGTLAPPPQRQGYAGVPAGLIQDMQTSEHDIQSALGMYQASVGQDSNAKSGKALDAQKTQGDMATFQFPDNLNKSVRHAGRIIMGMIPIIYDTPQVIRMLGEDGTPDYVSIDPEQAEAVKEQQGMDGTVKKIYNLGVGKYDVTISTGAGYATKRQEGAAFLTQVAQTNPDLMPIIGDLLFKSLDIPYADEIAARMKKSMPPELKDDAEEAPEVTAIKKQADEVIKQLQMQLDKAEQAMIEANQEANEKDGEIALKARELEIKQYDAETKRLQVELTQLQQQETIDPGEVEALKAAVAQLIQMIAPEPTEQIEETTEPAPAGIFSPE
jgi:hypothetical protein